MTARRSVTASGSLPIAGIASTGGEVSNGITDCSVKGIRRAVGPRKCNDFSVDGLKYEGYEKG